MSPNQLRHLTRGARAEGGSQGAGRAGGPAGGQNEPRPLGRCRVATPHTRPAAPRVGVGAGRVDLEVERRWLAGERDVAPGPGSIPPTPVSGPTPSSDHAPGGPPRGKPAARAWPRPLARGPAGGAPGIRRRRPGVGRGTPVDGPGGTARPWRGPQRTTARGTPIPRERGRGYEVSSSQRRMWTRPNVSPATTVVPSTVTAQCNTGASP